MRRDSTDMCSRAECKIQTDATSSRSIAIYIGALDSSALCSRVHVLCIQTMVHRPFHMIFPWNSRRKSCFSIALRTRDAQQQSGRTSVWSSRSHAMHWNCGNEEKFVVMARNKPHDWENVQSTAFFWHTCGTSATFLGRSFFFSFSPLLRANAVRSCTAHKQHNAKRTARATRKCARFCIQTSEASACSKL